MERYPRMFGKPSPHFIPKMRGQVVHHDMDFTVFVRNHSGLRGRRIRRLPFCCRDELTARVNRVWEPGSGSGRRWDGWLPGAAGDGVADGGHDVEAMLADGGDEAPDPEPVLGAGGGAVAAGDLQLGLDRPQVPFASVVT